MSAEKAPLNLNVDSELKYKFKRETAKPGLDMKSVIEALIKSYLDMTEKEKENLLKKYSE